MQISGFGHLVITVRVGLGVALLASSLQSGEVPLLKIVYNTKFKPHATSNIIAERQRQRLPAPWQFEATARQMSRLASWPSLFQSRRNKISNYELTRHLARIHVETHKRIFPVEPDIGLPELWLYGSSISKNPK